MLIIHPTYFPTIAHFVAIVNRDVVFEIHDNYQKQTYRNRMYIYGANGKQLLTIPVKHTKNKDAHQKYVNVGIDNSFNWQKQHWKTIQTAYRTSPYFEFYEDDIAPLFKNTPATLFELNLKTIELLCDCIGISIPTKKTEVYQETYPNKNDFRFLVNAKKELTLDLTPYIQVFSNKHGYIANLSILDLLFNEGPNTLLYLQQHQLHD